MNTDLIMIIFDEDMEDSVKVLLKRCSIPYQTIFRNIEGMGSSGLRNNTSVGPGFNIVYLIFAPEESSKKLFQSIEKLKVNNPNASIKLSALETKYFV